MNLFILVENVETIWIKNKSSKSKKKGKESISCDDIIETEETIGIKDEGHSNKKARKTYTSSRKAEILDQYYMEKANHSDLTLSSFSQKVGISKSMLARWIKSQKT